MNILNMHWLVPKKMFHLLDVNAEEEADLNSRILGKIRPVRNTNKYLCGAADVTLQRCFIRAFQSNGHQFAERKEAIFQVGLSTMKEIHFRTKNLTF